MRHFHKEDTNIVSLEPQVKKKTNSNYDSTKKATNTDTFAKSGTNILKSLKRSTTNYLQISRNSILIQKALYNNYINSIIIPLCILFIIMIIYRKHPTQVKFVDREDKSHLDIKKICNEFRQNLNALKHNVFMNKDEVTILVQNLMMNYKYVKGHIPNLINEDEITDLSNKAKVLTFFHREDSFNIASRVGLITKNLYILLNYAQDYLISKSKEEKKKSLVKYYEYMHDIKLEDPELSRKLNAFTFNMIQLYHKEGCVYVKMKYRQLCKDALSVYIAANYFCKILKNMRNCNDELINNHYILDLYQHDYLLSLKAEEFLNI